ncbi:3-methyladenine DNA glycosylase, partial [Marinitenerispora sediminis]
MRQTGAAVLEQDEWRALRDAHYRRVDALTEGHLRRRERGVRHPVEDFLFEYYSHRPARLRR